MIKTILIGWMMVMSIMLPGYSSHECKTDRVITLLECDHEMITDFCNGKLKDVILECKEGTSLPFEIHVKGEYLNLESKPEYSKIRILKTCYVRCPEPEKLLFSLDAKAWKNFSEFFTGMVGGSFGVYNGNPLAKLELDLKSKTEH